MYPQLTQSLAEARRAEFLELAAKRRIADDGRPEPKNMRRATSLKARRRRRFAALRLAIYGH